MSQIAWSLALLYLLIGNAMTNKFTISLFGISKLGGLPIDAKHG